MVSWRLVGFEISDALLAALIGAGATALAAIIGIGAILYQLVRQGRLNRESIEENERRRLKSKMYDEVESVCRSLSDSASSYLVSLITTTQQIQIASHLARDGQNYALPSARVIHLADLKKAYQADFFALIALIEHRQFVAPGILVFRSALSAASYSADQKFTRDFFEYAMRRMPTDRPDGQGIFPYEPPTAEDADELSRRAMSIVDDLQDVVTYAADFSVEMQNVLVCDLFGNEVKHRNPPDPRKRVITIADADELEPYFLHNTAWGEMVRAGEAEALDRFRPRPSETN